MLNEGKKKIFERDLIKTKLFLVKNEIIGLDSEGSTTPTVLELLSLIIYA